jgi:hypothetical protein
MGSPWSRGSCRSELIAGNQDWRRLTEAEPEVTGRREGSGGVLAVPAGSGELRSGGPWDFRRQHGVGELAREAHGSARGSRLAARGGRRCRPAHGEPGQRGERS